jgi:hypothetical protein
MSTDLEAQLVRGLTNAHAMEEQAIRLLDAATKVAGDEEIAAIYRAHLRACATARCRPRRWASP